MLDLQRSEIVRLQQRVTELDTQLQVITGANDDDDKYEVTDDVTAADADEVTAVTTTADAVAMTTAEHNDTVVEAITAAVDNVNV